MSGSSLDSVDVILAEIKKEKLKLIKTHSHPIDELLRNEILALCHPGENEIYRMGVMDVKLGRLFAEAIHMLLKKSHLTAQDIAAIGSHGQNIRHNPQGNYPFTLQIGDPNIIAAETGITTVADFRRRDMALGGQGAPLAPAFHNFIFKNISGTHGIVNIGGIANLTLLSENKKDIIGFDTGPGNTLLDAWAYHHLKKRYDNNGEWALSGKINIPLLNALLADEYFKKPYPKSTGREYFNLDWVKHYINSLDARKSTAISAADLQATLTELTAKTIADNINHYSSNKKNTHIWVCGGGAKNIYLMERLQAQCPFKILSTDAVGIPIEWVEAAAFAWFAQQTLHQQPSNIPSVTGAHNAAILGGIYCG